MVRRISIEAGCAPAPRRASTPCSQKGLGGSTAQQADVDVHQITFCFQAWHINNHPVSESAVSNRKMAEFVQSSLSREAASRWTVTTSPPLRPKPSLAAPVSVCRPFGGCHRGLFTYDGSFPDSGKEEAKD